VVNKLEPTVISTWRHGVAANAAAWAILKGSGLSIDAVEAGVRDSESDPECNSVGYGGYPDREGNVTVDACIMNASGDCGAVAFLQEIENAISVARLVMEKTPHVMLAGDGAQQFALSQGIEKKNLLTPAMKEKWLAWREKKNKEWHPEANWENEVSDKNHDTIGMLAIDADGDLAGACTTSGLAWKMKGRVGDSPIIGAGLYVDNEIGAASATGAGEAVVRAVGSFVVVEAIRQGATPHEACKIGAERVAQKNPNWKELQVGFIAIDKQGRVGGYSLKDGFDYAVQNAHSAELIRAEALNSED